MDSELVGRRRSIYDEIIDSSAEHMSGHEPSVRKQINYNGEAERHRTGGTKDLPIIVDWAEMDL